MNVEIDDFSGPLDLLLHLIKANKMDIYNINIETITKEYINYINSNKALTIDACSEYLVMASELVHLKSKLLLNNQSKDEDEEEYSINSEEELQRRLLEYQKYKELTEDFKQLELKRSTVYTKVSSNLRDYSDGISLNSDVTLNDLLNAFEDFLKRKKMHEPLNTKKKKKELSVEDRIVSIRKIVKTKGKLNFLDLFEEVSKPYVIVTFLSILNMTKDREIIITQDKNFGQIYIEGCN